MLSSLLFAEDDDYSHDTWMRNSYVPLNPARDPLSQKQIYEFSLMQTQKMRNNFSITKTRKTVTSSMENSFPGSSKLNSLLPYIYLHFMQIQLYY